MDPALQQIDKIVDPEEEIEAMIRLSDRRRYPSSIKVISQFGEIITCRVKQQNIQKVYNDPTVFSFKAPRVFYHDYLQVADSSAGSKYVQAKKSEVLSFTPLTGKGVIIGIIDWGGDFAHVDFLNEDGTSRFIALWDQSPATNEKSPQPFGYGKVYYQDEINAALQTEDPYASLGYHPGLADQKQQGMHGTHVLGIAAANGRSGHRGVAPEADIVFVHLASSNTDGRFNLGDSNRILEAIDFIKKTTGQRPLVINLSTGKHGGPHDGSTLLELGIDSFLEENQNTVICQSTGNYFNAKTHCSGLIKPGGKEHISFIMGQALVTENEVEIWYSGKDEFDIKLQHINSPLIHACAVDSSTDIVSEDKLIGRMYHRSKDPNNGRNHVDIFLYPEAPVGQWTLTIIGKKITDGRFHAWIERADIGQSVFVEANIVHTATTNTICNSYNPIIVGAYNQNDPQYSIAPFSSSGPTLDGRVKPHLLAPGINILSCKSSPPGQRKGSNQLTRMTGTSMASPYVTGIVALILQGINRTATIHDIRNIVFRSCLPVERKIWFDRLRGGYGIIDLERVKENIEWFNAHPLVDKASTMQAADKMNNNAYEEIPELQKYQITKKIDCVQSALQKNEKSGTHIIDGKGEPGSLAIDLYRRGYLSYSILVSILNGERNKDKLTDMVFQYRHPEERQLSKIMNSSDSEYCRLRTEWMEIKSKLIIPIFKNENNLERETITMSDVEANEVGQRNACGLAAALRHISEAEGSPKPAPVRARILWPALGFPAVIAPTKPASLSWMREADATRCITILILCDEKSLSKEQVARYLRYVPWVERSRRHIAVGQNGSFQPEELDRTQIYELPNSADSHAALIGFGGNEDGKNMITVSLAHKVRKFYDSENLKFLYEIRISERRSGELQDGLYHIFWNNEDVNEDKPSDEMALLLDRFARPRRQVLTELWKKEQKFLLEEYEYEYPVFHRTYSGLKGVRTRRTEVLHPFFVQRSLTDNIKISHLTDLHVDVRADVYEENLIDACKKRLIPERFRTSYNNCNTSFVKVYNNAKQQKPDVLLLTGDLIDYGRGHWGPIAKDHLGRDDFYHVDRNWFLFYYLLATGESYSCPVYTILGNHDWRLNPYPPFAIAGAPDPMSLFHESANLNAETLSKSYKKYFSDALRQAHGEGHERKFSYYVNAESNLQLLGEKPYDAIKALGRMVAQTSTMDEPHAPTETTVESVAWYLMLINPFLDYSFNFPSGHNILMLDWAEDEDVLFPIIAKGKEWPYMVWQADTASYPGPKAKNCLTGLQKNLVKEFLTTPGKSKIVGIHAPPIGPYPDWYDHDLFQGRKTYDNPKEGRGPTNYGTRLSDGSTQNWNGHLLFAIQPKNDAGVVADYGSFSNKIGGESTRDWFIKELSKPESGVRIVLSGHIHRNGLYIVHTSPKMKESVTIGEMVIRGVVKEAVRGVAPPAVTFTAEGKQGPLYVNTTSVGPRGHWLPRKGEHYFVDPGYAIVELKNDGTIQQVEFRSVLVHTKGYQNTASSVPVIQ